MSARIIQVPRPVSRTQVQGPEKIPKPREPADAPTLTAEYLRSVLHYEPETGIFTWKVSTAHSVKVGQASGCLDGHGYLRLRVCSRLYQAHRLAWLYVYGNWPKGQIDHINRNRSDNRIPNLRDVTNRQNQQNRSTNSDNTSGHPGVYWDKQSFKWRARIKHNQKLIHLGLFTDLEEAIAARKAGELRYWGVNRAD